MGKGIGVLVVPILECHVICYGEFDVAGRGVLIHFYGTAVDLYLDRVHHVCRIEHFLIGIAFYVEKRFEGLFEFETETIGLFQDIGCITYP